MRAMMDGAPFPPAELAHVPVQQHPAHAAALRRIGAGVRRIDLGDGGYAHALLRRLGPLRLALVPRGPVWPEPRAPRMDDLRALRRALPARTMLIVNGDGSLPRSLRILPLVTPQWVAEWDLTPPPDTLRAGLHQKWRNRLHRAGTAPVHEQAMPPDPDHWLLQHEGAAARRRGYAPWPAKLVVAHAAAGHARLFTAGPRDAPVAAMLFLLHGARATYQIGWSGAAGRTRDAHRLLLWHAAMALRGDGVRCLDLGTIDTETAPGLARFKLGTGARARPLGPTVLVP